MKPWQLLIVVTGAALGLALMFAALHLVAHSALIGILLLGAGGVLGAGAGNLITRRIAADMQARDDEE